MIEGLQLSATLREAVPYRITVPDRLIDPLITARERDGRIRLLHVSDFHLVEDIREPGSTKWRPLGAPTHSYETVRNLARVVRNLNPDYDLVLATGDLTTDGSREAFETARQFIQSGSLSGGKSMRIATFGLSAGVGRRILLPGNHDRFGNELLAGQRSSSVFEEMLDTHKGYPYVVGFRPPNWDSTALTILFFVFDSNLHEVPAFTDAPGRLHSIAQGIVELEEIDSGFDELAKKVAVSGQVEGLRGEMLKIDIGNTIRVAVLHHHPFISAEEEREARKNLSIWRNPVKSFKQARGKYDASLVAMRNSEAFLRGCFRAGIQLILFGHQHDPYYRPVCRVDGANKMITHFGEMPSVIHGFCCASALEHTEQENGFYVLDFFENRQLVVDFYSSKRSKGQSGEFLRVAEKSRVLDLSTHEVDKADATWVTIEG
nr:hypothetical protein [uncultured bacterium]